MATRNFNTKFWRDTYVETLDPSEKLLFIYLFTNPEARMCGIYEMPSRIMCSDTGFNADMIERLFHRLNKDKKAAYIDGWVCTYNTIKHQNLNNLNTQKGIKRELSEVPPEIMKKIKESAPPDFEKNLEKVNKLKTENEPEIVETPEWLNTEAWLDWCEYRSSAKKKITEKARAMQWKFLEPYSKDDQRKIIDNSITNDYQGLFPLKNHTKKEMYVA